MALGMFRMASVTVFVLAGINLVASVATGDRLVFADALIFAVLGYFALHRSLIALGLALGSYSLGSLMLIMLGGIPSGVLTFRIVVTAILIGGLVALSQLKQQIPSLDSGESHA